MAALSCGCSKLFNGGSLVVSKYAVSSIGVGCTEMTRLNLWQKKFHTSSSRKKDGVAVQRKKRDRFTVLKVLASTVDYVPSRPEKPFLDDMVLYPKHMSKKRFYEAASHAGDKAADFFLSSYPHLFPLRQPVPAWPDNQDLMSSLADISVTNLQLLLKNGENASKVVEWYKELCTQEELSIDVHNKVLDYVTFHAVPSETPSDGQKHLVKEGEIKWNEDMFAEQIFEDLNEKCNARTYEVFILGLLKHGEIFRGFELYQELMEKGFNGTLFLYNTLLSHVCDAAEGDKERWELSEDIIASMCKDNIIPNVVTFNRMMAIANQRRGDSTRLCVQLLREMKKKKIVPSLGTFNFILQAEKRQSVTHPVVLNTIIQELSKVGAVDFSVRYREDLEFFPEAMGVVRFQRNPEQARRLKVIALQNKEFDMPRDLLDRFYGQYIATISRVAIDVEELYREYKELVPKEFVPRGWGMAKIFFAMKRAKDPRRLPELYAEMVKMRIPFTELVATPLFSAMMYNIPKERAEEFLYVITSTEKWMDIYRIEQTFESMSVAITVYCLCEDLKEVKRKLEECKALGINPSLDSLIAALELNVKKTNIHGAMSTLEFMAKQGLSTGPAEDIINETPFLSERRKEIESLFSQKR